MLTDVSGVKCDGNIQLSRLEKCLDLIGVFLLVHGQESDLISRVLGDRPFQLMLTEAAGDLLSSDDITALLETIK